MNYLGSFERRSPPWSYWSSLQVESDRALAVVALQVVQRSREVCRPCLTGSLREQICSMSHNEAECGYSRKGHVLSPLSMTFLPLFVWTRHLFLKLTCFRAITVRSRKWAISSLPTIPPNSFSHVATSKSCYLSRSSVNYWNKIGPTRLSEMLQNPSVLWSGWRWRQQNPGRAQGQKTTEPGGGALKPTVPSHQRMSGSTPQWVLPLQEGVNLAPEN